jgi:2-hydroxychromene-2-carboxylate isomerase
MRNRTRMIAAAAVIAALAAGSGAAAASTTGAKPGAPAKTLSASGNPDSPAEVAGHNAMVAAVAQELHMSTARVSAALQPLFAAGRADTSSVVAAAARSLGVSTQQLSAALAHAKQSLGGGTPAKRGPGGSKAVGANSAEKAGHDAIVAVVARELHVSTARVSAALQPLFSAGRADTSSSAFAAAARSLGVSTQQLSAALGHGKQSLAPGN